MKKSIVLVMFLGITLSSCASCSKNKPIITLNGDVAMTTGDANYDAESTAVAIPPNGKCGDGTTLPNGRVIVSSGTGRRLLMHDLIGGGGQKTLNVPSTEVPLDEGYAGEDHQLARLRNGDLLQLWAGFTWKDFVGADGNHPGWWDTKWTNPDLAQGTRGAMHIWRSSDCGTTWTYDTMIDSAKVKIVDDTMDPQHLNDEGRCAWPQDDLDDKGFHKVIPGGWDREEVYVDPFDGRVYFSAGCGAGGAGKEKIVVDQFGTLNKVFTEFFPGRAFSAQVILASDQDAHNWPDSDLLSPPLGGYTPVVMTSTAAGKLFAHQCMGNKPGLHRQLQPPGAAYETVFAFSGIEANNTKDCDGLAGDSLVGHPEILKENNSITRVYRSPGSGVQVVRVAYPATEDFTQADNTVARRQVWMVTIVLVKLDGTMLRLLTHEIKAGDNKGNILQATFVETDRTELASDSQEDAALLYWIEELVDEGKLIVRGQVVRDSMNWSDTFDLSSKWTPHFNGHRGDYIHGAFYFADGQLNFLAQWSQSDEPAAGALPKPNLNIHYNVVRLGVIQPPSGLSKLFGGVASKDSLNSPALPAQRMTRQAAKRPSEIGHILKDVERGGLHPFSSPTPTATKP